MPPRMRGRPSSRTRWGVLDRVFTKFGRPNNYTFWDTSVWDEWWLKQTRTLDTAERRAAIKGRPEALAHGRRG